MPVTPPDHYLIIDFEATYCDEGTVPREQMEIIEVGAVMVEASTLRAIDEFQVFIRPVRHPEFTAFCTRLTSIRQQDVDSAPGFAEAMSRFKDWLYRYGNFVFCSWGDYDMKQLKQDCNFHRLPNPIGAPHLNLKRVVAERQQLAKKPGLGDAVRMAGLQFQGNHHRGIDDARNIARLLPYAFGEARLAAPATSPRGGRRG